MQFIIAPNVKMDMGTSSTMVVSVASSTATGNAAAATTTAAMSMSDSSCKISMLWNWYTVDSCFIARSWHITSRGMFAGSCIGVVLLVMSLEFLRRTSKEYDQYILLQAQKKYQEAVSDTPAKSSGSSDRALIVTPPALLHFRPSVLQQGIRAGLHTVQFAIAYFVMLLAMYYNGYIIISIIIGAYLGAFVFSWETIKLGGDTKQEATFCCG